MLPPVVNYLKCFLHDPDGGVVKIRKSIQFTPELKILPGTISLFLFPHRQPILTIHGFVGLDVMAPITPKPTGPRPGSYALYGVLCHHGISESGGRYTIDVLHPNGNSGDGRRLSSRRR